jgi:hypothetical protein
MIGTTVAMFLGAALVTFNGLNRNPPKGAIFGVWKKVIAYAITPAVSLFGLTLMPVVLSSMDTNEVRAMQSDQAFLHPIRMLEGGDRSPVAVLSRTGDIRRIAAIIDRRAIPESVRASDMEDNPLPEALRIPSVDNPVVRFTARLDCTDGSYRYENLEVAKSVSSPAAAGQAMPSAKRHVLEPVDRDTLCNAPVAQPPSN